MGTVSEEVRQYSIRLAGIDMLEGQLRSERRAAEAQALTITQRLMTGEATADPCMDAAFLIGRQGDPETRAKFHALQANLHGRTGELFLLVYHGEKDVTDDLIQYLGKPDLTGEEGIHAPQRQYQLEQRFYLGILMGDSLAIDAPAAIVAIPTQQYAEVVLDIDRVAHGVEGSVKPGNLSLNAMIEFLGEYLELQGDLSRHQLGRGVIRFDILIGERMIQNWIQTYSKGRFAKPLASIARELGAKNFTS